MRWQAGISTLAASCILVALFLTACSSSDPPSCDNTDVKDKAWSLLNESSFSKDIQLGYGPGREYESSNQVIIPGSSLLAAISWAFSSERTSKYDATIHKRWCQADLQVSYDPNKVDLGTIKYPEADSDHQIFKQPSHSVTPGYMLVPGWKPFGAAGNGSGNAPVKEQFSSGPAQDPLETINRIISGYSVPHVVEYAVQRTDDGETYVTLERAPE